MNKTFQALATGQSFTDFTTKLTSRWRLLTNTSGSKPLAAESPEDILRDLIGMPTVSGNAEAMHDALDYIDRCLREAGMHVTRLEWNGTDALVATSRPTKTPIVYLAGHLDVVPADESMFELREEDGKYFGRGVLDMKSAIAAYLSVIKSLPGNIADYDFGVMIMTDEEIGGFNGAANLAAEGYLSKVMILPDGGGPDWNMEKFAKGIWHVTLEARGASAHGSRPWEGVNAIEKLQAVIAEIKTFFPDQAPGTSTFNLGVIQGGETINQIPGFASASIDMRFSSKAEQRRISAAIMDILERENVTLNVEVVGEPMTNDPNDPYLKTFAACTESVIGKPIDWVISNAANDGRYFASRGVACAISYPTGGNHHGPGEWISKESYDQLQRIVADYLQQVALPEGTAPS